MKMETLQQRRDELERKEQRLKESLLKFDKFLKVWQLGLLAGQQNYFTERYNYFTEDYACLSDNYVGLQENDLKRARALKKAKLEQELSRQKDKEIERQASNLCKPT